MSMALERFCLIVSLTIPSAHALSTIIGVAGCLCWRNSSVTRSGQHVCALWNAEPVSASAADAITCFNIPVATWIGPFLCVVWSGFGVLARKMKPAKRDLALGADR